MRGFTPQRKAAPKRFAEGGLIRGPGTGTSDDIPDKMRPGTFILPADTTNAMGLNEEEEPDADDMSGASGSMEEGEPDADDAGKVPVRVSNGEFEITPEQVQAIGAAVLRTVKNVTHEGQEGEAEMPSARGFAPGGKPPAFADGGVVPFGSRGLAGLKAMIPQMAAMGFQPQSQSAPASRSASALKAVIPQVEAMGYQQAQAPQEPQFFSSGGVVAPRGFRPRGSYVDDAMASMAQERDARKVQAPMVDNEGVQYLAQGDEVLGKKPNSFGDSAAVAADNSVKPVSPTNSPDAGRSPSGLYMQDRAKEIKDQVSSGNYAQAIGTGARTAVQGLGMYGIEAADKLATPVLNATRGFTTGLFNSESSGEATSNPAPAPAPAAAPVQPANVSGNGLGNMGPPDLSQLPQQVTAPSGKGVVTKDGNSYSGGNVSGDVSINGKDAGGGYVAGIGQANPTARGFAPASEFVAPTVRHSGNDWQARNDLRNLEVSASSITNRPEWSRAGKADADGKIARYNAALAADLKLRGEQPGVDLATQRENASLQREGMQQLGSIDRTAIQEAGQNQRAQGRLGVEQGDLELRRTAQGFQSRAALQQEQLRGVIADPKSTQAQREQAQRTLEALNGKGEHWKGIALQGGTDAQGNKTDSVLAAVNERTGEMRRMDSGQGQQFKKGEIYQDAGGQRRRWNGSGWEKV